MADPITLGLLVFAGSRILKAVAGGTNHDQACSAPPPLARDPLNIPPGHRLVVHKKRAKVVGEFEFAHHHVVVRDPDGALRAQDLEVPPYDADGRVLHDPKDAVLLKDSEGNWVWRHRDSTRDCANCGNTVLLSEARRLMFRAGHTAWFCLGCIKKYAIDPMKASPLGMIENKAIEGKFLPQLPNQEVQDA